MSQQVDLGTFSCSACNRHYPWKPAYANRQVKCKCGNVMTAPAEAPKPPPPQDQGDDDLLGGLYDLAEQEQQAAKVGAVDTGLRCPSCHSDLLPGQTVCPSCQFNLKTGLKERAQRATGATGAAPAPGSAKSNPMLGYAGMNKRGATATRADMENAIGGGMLTEMYVPAAAVLAGLGAQVFLHGYVAGAWRGVGYAMPEVGLSLLINLVLSFVGVAIAGQLFELSFGSPGPAALKLVALCLLPTAIAEAVGSVVGHDSFFVRAAVSTMLMTPLLVGGFMWLYQFAFDEAAYCAVIIYLVNRWALYFLLGAILTGSIGGMPGGHKQSNRVIEADEAAAEQVDRPNATESKSWLGETTNHMFGREGHDGSVDLVNSLYDAGAKRCTTMSESGSGYALIVQLPSKQAARDKCFALIHAEEDKVKIPKAEQMPDEGQAYYTIDFIAAGP